MPLTGMYTLHKQVRLVWAKRETISFISEEGLKERLSLYLRMRIIPDQVL
jgi:hypothetical protein